MGKRRTFDARAFLDAAGLSKHAVEYRRNQTIFSQGDPSTSVMYIQQGGVKLSVSSRAGREAVLAVLGPGDFFGEGCLGHEPLRLASATAITPCCVLAIDREPMKKVLHDQRGVSDRLISHMLARQINVEQDLIAQLFNSNEKRLARILLGLARYGRQGSPRQIVSRISQDRLSGMAGLTRARVAFFMNGFRRRGFIAYGPDLEAGIQINRSLLSVVLQD